MFNAVVAASLFCQTNFTRGLINKFTSTVNTLISNIVRPLLPSVSGQPTCQAIVAICFWTASGAIGAKGRMQDEDGQTEKQALPKHASQQKRLYMSRLMRKPTICICENKDADQLRGNREADQRLCFRYSDSTIPLLLKSKISIF